MRCMEVWGGNHPVDSGVAMPGLDAWVYSRPYAKAAAQPASAGGDVYYVSSCAGGQIARLLVADVSGHGTTVSEVALSLRTLMRKYVNYLNPEKFVGEMNRRFAELTENGSFATAVVSTFFSPTNQVTFCNAGHPPPLLYQPGHGWSYLESREVEGDAPADLPLGIEGTSAYSQSWVKLRRGDLVLCYTDGLPESRGADGDFLGQAGLLEIARTIDVADPTKVVPALLKAIEDVHPGNLTGDDITVLLFRASGDGANSSFARRLLAPFRLAKELMISAFPGGGPPPWPDYHPAPSVWDRFRKNKLPAAPNSSAAPVAAPRDPQRREKR